MVVPPGIEPGTQGFSVLCSTDWATEPDIGRNDRIWTYDILIPNQVHYQAVLHSEAYINGWIDEIRTHKPNTLGTGATTQHGYQFRHNPHLEQQTIFS